MAAAGSWMAASSLHPGGINASFCDGSVHFIKSSINSWAVSGGNAAVSPTYYTTNNGIISLTAQAQIGVWQAITTKANGEVISSDSY